MISVRFAPSPTGPLTLGNARTALFNWLYAKRNEGRFLLRIEDTDKERSKPEYEKNILEGLRWLGLDWDGEIYRQSERTEIYKKYLFQLLEEGNAYYCFCTPEELEEERQAQLSQGLPPKYSGKCRKISKREAEEKIKAGERYVIRFKMPGGKIEFEDLIRGRVEFDAELIGDFVIAKNLEHPLYNFAVVVDDYEMKITHVIRGEDHISNTPKQIAIQKVLGFNGLIYAHLPLLLAPGGQKLSKRLIQNSVLDYKKNGYLPEAMFNFLLLLGWHPKEDKEIVSREEAVKTFSLKRVQKSGAVLNEEKLNWYNAYYIRNIDEEKLLKYVEDFIPPKWKKNKKLLVGALKIEKNRMKKLTDFKELAGFFFELPEYSGELLIWKDKKKESLENLKKILEYIKNLKGTKLSSKNIETFLLKLSEQTGGKGEVYWPFRVALSGQNFSPSALQIIEILEKEEVIKRLEIALKKLENG